ncbi:MAG: hypothetical protein R3A48_19670 [Polyangiales bacterium]
MAFLGRRAAKLDESLQRLEDGSLARRRGDRRGPAIPTVEHVIFIPAID